MNSHARPTLFSPLWFHAALLLLAFGAACFAPTPARALGLLRASGTNIVDANGNIVQLRGLNLGGWLVIEPWMTPADSGGLPDEYSIVSELDRRFGVAAEQSLLNTYRDNWISAVDIANIKNAGFNVVRVPVWWGDFFTLASNGAPSGWRPDAFAHLDWLIAQCKRAGIYVIVDMHGVVGGQSTSDDTGWQNQNQYWTSATDRTETDWMMTKIAKHYKGNATVAAYDLMNEPMNAPSASAVLSAYADLYTTVRAADPDHICIIEGCFGSWNWSMLPAPSTYGWTNVVYEMHEYQWNGDAQTVENGAVNQVSDFENHAWYGVPDYVGEFNNMGDGAACCAAVAETYDNGGLNWSMWSYKTSAGLYPDSWGYYTPTYWPSTPNVSTDSQSTIASEWAGWRTEPSLYCLNDQVLSPASQLQSGCYLFSPACAPSSALTTVDADLSSGTQTDIWAKNASASEKWLVASTSGSMVQIAPFAAPVMRLDVDGGADQNYAAVDIATDDDSGAQQWQLLSDGAGFFNLTPECALGLDLDVYHAESANGTTVDIYSANGTNAQAWSATPAPRSLTGVVFPPGPVSGASKVTGTVTLSSAAVEPVKIALSSSDPALASVAATCTVPSGGSSATFTVTVSNPTADTNVTITASHAGVKLSQMLTVAP
jgi:hypothetical protein